MNNEIKKESVLNSVNILLGIVAIFVMIVIYVLYQKSLQPKDIVVKEIANRYRVNYSSVSDIKIIKFYEDKGKLVYILNIKGSICEMPMLKVKEEWKALEISCRN